MNAETEHTRLELVIRRVFEMAWKGNLRAVEIIFDRLEGKPRQQILTEIKEFDSIIVTDNNDDYPDAITIR